MQKKFCGITVLIFALALLLLSACGENVGSSSGNTGSNANSSPSPARVNLEEVMFNPSTITITKGQSIILTDQVNTVHVLANGSWNNNSPRPGSEVGAPLASNIQFSVKGQSVTIGPFNTAGQFHFYCRVHTGMNLLVIVKA